MNPYIYATLATILYSMGSVLIEHKLAPKLGTSTLQVVFYIVMILMAITRFSVTGHNGAQTSFPTGTLLYTTIGVGALYYIADLFFFKAHTSGGSAVAILLLVALSPLWASLGEWVVLQKVPTPRVLIGMSLGAISIILISTSQTTTK